MRNEELMPSEDVKRIADFLDYLIKCKKEALEIVEAWKGLKAPTTPTSNQQNQPQTPNPKRTEEEKELLRISREIQKTQAQINSSLGGQNAELLRLKATKQQQLALQRAIAKEETAAEGSDAKKSATLSRMIIQHRMINKETKEGVELASQMEKEMLDLNNVLLKSETARGQFGRNVGNYASGFSQLGFSIQQVVRETPSATHSLQQYFLAISNNIPMLQDSINWTKADIAAKKAHGQAYESLGKQIFKNIFSWQTLTVGIITLLISYGDEISGFFKKIISGYKSIDIATEAVKKINEAIDYSDLGKKIANLERLSRLYAELGDNAAAKTKFLKDYRSELDATGVSIKTIADADNLFITNTDAYIKALDLRARANAAQSLAEKEYTKSYEDYVDELGSLYSRIEGVKTMPDNYVEYLTLGLSGAAPITVTKGEIIHRLQTQVDQILEGIGSASGSVFSLLSTQLNMQAKEILSGAGFQETKDSPEGSDRGRLKSLRDLASATHNIQQKMAEEDLKLWSESNKELTDDQKQSFDVRLTSLQEYIDTEKKLLEQRAANQRENLIQDTINKAGIDDSGTPRMSRAKAEAAVASEILAIDLMLYASLAKVESDGEGERLKIQNEAAQNRIAAIVQEAQERQRIIEESESRELAALSGTFTNQEDYEREKLNITRKYAIQREQAGLSALEQELAILKENKNLTVAQEQEIANLEGKILDYKVEMNKNANDRIIDDNERAFEREKELQERRKQMFLDIANAISDIAGELSAAATQREMDSLDEQQKAAEDAAEEEKDRIERLAEAGAISEEQKNARINLADEQLAKKQEEIDLRKRQLQARQARYNHAVSLSEAGTSGTLSTLKAWELGPIAGVIAAATVGATVAALIAEIANTEIPQYATGTDFHPGGLAVVGDGGRSELLLVGGYAYKTPAVPTLVDMPKGAQVMLDYNVAIRDMIMMSTLQNGRRVPKESPRVETFSDRSLLKELRDLKTLQATSIRNDERARRQSRFIEFKNRKLT